MLELKENKSVMDEKIKKVLNDTVNCLMGKKFKKIILGVVVDKDNGNFFNDELFYLDTNEKYVYVNKISWEEKTNSELDDLLDILQHSILDVMNYCYKYDDKWDSMTIVIEENGKFDVNFSYEPTDIFKWRGMNIPQVKG